MGIDGEWFEAFYAIMQRVPNIDKATVSVHCHNDLGMAVANSLEAIRAGVGQVEGCFNGVGERAGNASLEEIIMALGEATVKIRDNGHQVIGRAVTTDVIEASVLAYVNAMNKIVEERTMCGEKIPMLHVP